MTKKLVWRLSQKPTVSELTVLLEKGIITKEEAKEVLFNQEEQVDRDKKSLEGEVRFLRELVEKLSNNQRSTIIETIKYVEKPYQQYPWIYPYQVWCGTGSTTVGTVTGATITTDGSTALFATNTGSSFSSIKTF